MTDCYNKPQTCSHCREIRKCPIKDIFDYAICKGYFQRHPDCPLDKDTFIIKCVLDEVSEHCSGEWLTAIYKKYGIKQEDTKCD